MNPKNQETYKLEYLIVELGFTPLLGECTIQQLHFMSINTNNTLSMNVSQELAKSTLTRADILSEYKDVFTGQGKFVEELHLDVDEVVRPVQNSAKRVPIAIKVPIKQEL